MTSEKLFLVLEKWLPGILGVLFVVSILMGILFPGGSDPNAARRTQARNDVSTISAAVKSYQVEYEMPPSGKHAAMLRALLGDNPRKIVFVDVDPVKNPNVPKNGLANGLWYDPWGSPYRIEVSDPKNPRVWSPGKNKKDEPDDPHSDDICSWR
jgi:hypothetical protein